VAQIHSVRLPHRRALGALPKPTLDDTLALVAVVGGLGGALTIWLYAVGKQREAATLAVTGAVIGAFVGAAKLLGD
jgi:hypothetical protein